jgi:hypothetical protein
MLDQMQVSTVVSPCPQEEQGTFISPMPQQVVLGHITVTNDQEEFLQALDAGIEAYCEDDYSFATTITAQDLLNDLLETLQDDTPLAWRLGFISQRGTLGVWNYTIQWERRGEKLVKGRSYLQTVS